MLVKRPKNLVSLKNKTVLVFIENKNLKVSEHHKGYKTEPYEPKLVIFLLGF